MAEHFSNGKYRRRHSHVYRRIDQYCHALSGHRQTGSRGAKCNSARRPGAADLVQRDSEHEETDLSGAGGLIESRWNIEVHTDEDDNRFDIADAIKRRMNGYYGAFGSRKVQGVFIEDHDDDYFPRGVGSEDGLYVAALTATIWFATT